MNIKKLIIAVSALLIGLFTVPNAAAEVVVRLIAVDNGYSNGYSSHREPMGYYAGTRLYSNSRYGNYNHSYGDRYNNRRHYNSGYYKPRQYRNDYYHGYRNDRSRCGGLNYYRDRGDRNHRNRHNSHYDNDRRRNYDYRRDAPHHNNNGHRSYQHQEKYQSSGGRVHIKVK